MRSGRLIVRGPNKYLVLVNAFEQPLSYSVGCCNSPCSRCINCLSQSRFTYHCSFGVVDYHDSRADSVLHSPGMKTFYYCTKTDDTRFLVII